MVWPTLDDEKIAEHGASNLPGLHMPAAHALTPLDHVLNLDIDKPPALQRLTGIMAIIGAASKDVEVMEQMIASGMNIALLNLAYESRDEHIETIKKLREAATNFSMRMGKNCPLAIAINLSGRKIRTGKLSDVYGAHAELKTGEIVRLTSDETYREKCSIYTIFVDFMGLGEQVRKGDRVLIDNEALELKIEMISTTTITCKIVRGGFLGSFKDVFVPNIVFDMPNFTEKDKLDIDMGIRQQVDMIVVPLVHCTSSLEELRGLLGNKGKKIHIVAEIQTVQGYNNFDHILEVANGVMITRQELGSDISPKKLVVAQKNLIARANMANIPISVKAQLLSSMTVKKIPLRAEILDISNCVLDGVDTLVLSAETAIGEHPVEAVAALASACKEAEACIWTRQLFQDLVDKTPVPCDQATGTAIASVIAAQKTLAAAIVVVTTSGRSAQIVAKYKPRCPIIAVTRYPVIARQLHSYRGVMPLIYEDSPHANWLTDLQSRTDFCIRFAIDRGFARVGDAIILVAGWRQGSGFTNTMRVIYASEYTPDL